jgi:hypothetical protein
VSGFVSAAKCMPLGDANGCGYSGCKKNSKCGKRRETFWLPSCDEPTPSATNPIVERKEANPNKSLRIPVGFFGLILIVVSVRSLLQFSPLGISLEYVYGHFLAMPFITPSFLHQLTAVPKMSVFSRLL